VFDPADIQGIKHFVATAYEERGAARASGNADRVKQFELDAVTARLAEELDGVCA
jgi:hypothetical protein